MKRLLPLVCGLAVLLLSSAAAAQPAPVEGDFSAAGFALASGQSLPELRMHYRTLGQPRRGADGRVENAVLLLHGTGGTGAQFLSPQFAGELFGPGQPLDVARYYIVMPDNLGHGGSSKPSDGQRARFPEYGYADMVEALMPMACQPTAIVGRNRLWRTMLKDAIRSDPVWAGGDYVEQPVEGLRTAVDLLLLAGSAPMAMQQDLATPVAADEWLAAQQARRLPALDANDLWYQVNASFDYDPSAGLERITAPMTWINSADDFINPPELGLAEQFVPRIAGVRYRLVPNSVGGKGHGTHTWAMFWKDDLIDLLARTEG